MWRFVRNASAERGVSRFSAARWAQKNAPCFAARAVLNFRLRLLDFQNVVFLAFAVERAELDCVVKPALRRGRAERNVFAVERYRAEFARGGFFPVLAKSG